MQRGFQLPARAEIVWTVAPVTATSAPLRTALRCGRVGWLAQTAGRGADDALPCSGCRHGDRARLIQRHQFGTILGRPGPKSHRLWCDSRAHAAKFKVARCRAVQCGGDVPKQRGLQRAMNHQPVVMLHRHGIWQVVMDAVAVEGQRRIAKHQCRVDFHSQVEVEELRHCW